MFEYLSFKFSSLVEDFFCRLNPELFKIIDLPCDNSEEYNGIVIGSVLAIHIKDEFIENDRINLKKMRPLSRLGYLDYSTVDSIFEMERPAGSPRPDNVTNLRRD